VATSLADSGAADRSVGHTIPSRLNQGVAVDDGAWVAADAPRAAEGSGATSAANDQAGRRDVPTAVAERTDLALEADPRDAGAFTVEPLPPDPAPEATPGRPVAQQQAGREVAADAAGANADGRSQGRWRLTPRMAGTHRLRLVAVDVRDSAGRVDTTARRTVATVPVNVRAPSEAAGVLAETWRTAWQTPAGWAVACLLSFLLGWYFRGRGRGSRAAGRG
jgi:hypothetical protein